jgi:RNA polymerase sigma-70 factor (ECF subfamily)
MSTPPPPAACHCGCSDYRTDLDAGRSDVISELASRLVRDHARRLAAIARREGVAPADALDVVQDAFHTLLTLLRRPGGAALCARPGEAARLLSAIVRNAARNHRRRHHRARPHVDADRAPLPAGEPAADAALDRARELAQLGGCLAALGDVHRRVVTLRVLEELSGDEAARALGLSPGHVATLLYRARKQLERCMAA